MKKIIWIFLILFTSKFTFGIDNNLNIQVDSNGTITNAGQWYTSIDVDEFDGEHRTFIFSKKISPNKPLSFPMKNTDPVFAIQCIEDGKKDKCRMYLYFKELILSGGDLEDGFTVHDIRVRLDSGEIITMQTTLRFGSKYLNIYRGSRMNKYMRKNNELLLEIDHYGDGRRLYKLDTKGFKEIMDSNFPNGYRFYN